MIFELCLILDLRAEGADCTSNIAVKTNLYSNLLVASY
jgi:hypothetical protein